MRWLPYSIVAAGLAVAGPAQAQRSLFDQAPVDPSAGFTPATPAPSPALTPAPSSAGTAPPPSRAAAPVPLRASVPPPTAAPAADAAQPEASEPAATRAPRRRAARPKPKGPHPAAALTIVNGSSAVITAIAIEGEGKTASYTKELAPNGRATIKLPTLKGCTVSVTTTYGTDAPNLPGEVDVCKDRIVKLGD